MSYNKLAMTVSVEGQSSETLDRLTVCQVVGRYPKGMTLLADRRKSSPTD